MSVRPNATDANTSEELARFREEWKEEVRRKKAAAQTGPSPTQSTGLSDATSSKAGSLDAYVKGNVPEASRSGVQPPRAHVKQVPRATDTTSAPLGPKLQRAVEIYRRAVVCEQQSNLDEALELYRTAFRMDPNVDRAYHKVEAQFYVTTNVPVSQLPANTTSSSKRASVEEVTHHLKSLDVHSAVVPTAPGGDAIPHGSLASIMAEWPHELEFLPEEERRPVHIQKLPVEVLLVVLRKLDITGIERFALVSRKARCLTLDMSLWKCVYPRPSACCSHTNFSASREFVETVYKPPQISEDEELDGLLTSYVGDYRRLYIEQPRVRLDGVYIAICHYTYVHILLPIERICSKLACGESSCTFIVPRHSLRRIRSNLHYAPYPSDLAFPAAAQESATMLG